MPVSPISLGQGVVQLAETSFIDLYEVLQLSPNATAETVERVYRMLAKRFHPDNQDTGDAVRFAQIQQAYDTLTTPSSRLTPTAPACAARA